jgi:hypothetical protein
MLRKARTCLEKHELKDLEKHDILFSSQLVLNLAFAPSWVYGTLFEAKIRTFKCPMCEFLLQQVSTTVQMPNLALIENNGVQSFPSRNSTLMQGTARLCTAW